jgi:hypothetical protein
MGKYLPTEVQTRLVTYLSTKLDDDEAQTLLQAVRRGRVGRPVRQQPNIPVDRADVV